MTLITKYPPKYFSSVTVHGQRVTPFIQLIEIGDLKNAKLSYAGNSAEHLAALRRTGVFSLDPKLNNPGDILANSGIQITPAIWFFQRNTTNALFEQEVEKHKQSMIIVSSNAGNAPLHDYEVNYAIDQSEPLAAKDFEVKGKPITQRRYYCAIYKPEKGVSLGYVQFTENGKPLDSDISVAVGGRPLVHQDEPVSLDEVLTTSITDTRHVVRLPELDLGGNTFVALGLRSIQHYINNSQAAEIINKIKRGDPILIDLEREKDCCGESALATIPKAISDYNYLPGDYWLSNDLLFIRLQFNPYRHTFWATKENHLFIGIINNDLARNNGSINSFLYKRVIKPVGLTIPQLQEFIIEELKAEEAVLLGNGKDPRIYISEHPHVNKIEPLHDNDITLDERSSITAGMISVIL